VEVVVVDDCGGAASGLCGAEPMPPPVSTIAPASPAARANIATVPASNAFWVRLNRDRLTDGTRGMTGT
jgi:hypothetical protein